MENQGFGRENPNCKQSADKSKQSADEKVNNQLTFKGLKKGLWQKSHRKTRFLARKFKL